MKKTFHSIFALALAAIGATGCTDEVQVGNAFLDKAPGGTMNLDSIFSNPDYINQFLTNIYNKQYYGLPYNQGKNQAAGTYNGKLDALTDLYQLHWAGSKVWNSYYTGTMSAKEDPLISYTNDYVWKVVHEVSVMKENIYREDLHPNMTDKQKDYIVAQAKAIQAFEYATLLPHYGGLPIIEKTITDASEMVSDEYGERRIGERCTFEQTVDAIVKWCDEAAPYLYWAYNGNDDESSSRQTGRWTKAGVMALKAQVLWLAASPLYNSNESFFGGESEAVQKNLVWYGNYDQKRWERALQAFEEFWAENQRNGDYYHLYEATTKNNDGYRLAYRRGYMFDDSPENIHWTKVAGIFGSQGAYSWLSWNWVENGVRRLVHSPSLEYVEMFPWSDGKPFDREKDLKYSYSYTDAKDDKKTWDVYTCLSGTYDKMFYTYKEIRGGFSKTASRDPRLYENVTVTGTPKNLPLQSTDGKATGDIKELWVGGQDAGTCVKDPADYTQTESLTSYCPTGFGAYKYVLNQIEWWRDPNMHWNALTIPDMILMYAECLAECGRNEDAITQVDKIRSRVGLKGIVSCNTALDLKNNKQNLIEEILRERACELGMTNARYIDMIRRMRTDWMTKKLHGMATFRMIKNAQNQWVRRNAPWYGDDKNSGQTEPARFEYEIFDLTQGYRVFWDMDQNSNELKKWLMMPFPQDEINKGYGLIQNPGW
ncbi:MAG: RagB/SusD family nutrient uptake outer membrane protein [Muribaculaceae bacterium]|nr:RagB/SusD family nutrient uptake outer membrane protein [Muribaculaceae bacterium]